MNAIERERERLSGNLGGAGDFARTAGLLGYGFVSWAAILAGVFVLGATAFLLAVALFF